MENISIHRIAKMAEILGVSESGYHAWIKRQGRAKTEKEKQREELKTLVMHIYIESNCVYGSRKITKVLKKKYRITVNHKRVENIMKEAGIVSKTVKKYKATTNSKHDLPVAPNLLNREFTAEKPCQKMVSDITYIPTDEGWLYLASVMDLCGRKIVGMAMGARMKKDLVIRALKDAVNHSGDVKKCILHSDYAEEKTMPKFFFKYAV